MNERDNVFWKYRDILGWNRIKYWHPLPCGFEALPIWVNEVCFFVPMMLSEAPWLVLASDISAHTTWAEALNVNAGSGLASYISVLARKTHAPGCHWSQNETNVINLNRTHSLEAIPAETSRALANTQPVNMNKKQMLLVNSYWFWSCYLELSNRNLTDTNIQ